LRKAWGDRKIAPPPAGVQRRRDRKPAVMTRAAIFALALSAAAVLAGPRPASAQLGSAQPAVPAACEPAGGLAFVCGLVNVEDFLPVDGGRFLVGSSFKLGSAGLYLIDTTAKTARQVILSIAIKPDWAYAGCRAPDLARLSTHGLDVKDGPHGTATVYAVNHGGRESVEVFRLNPARATAEWIGCVRLPQEVSGNSVAALPRGGFAVTKFLDTTDKQSMQKVMAGQANGLVYVWAPGKGLRVLPGSQLSGDNGLVVSPDGKWLYVNAYGTREVWRIPASGQGERTSVKVDFYPDNLRWAPDGQLFVTGQVDVQAPAGRHGWATVKLDPQAMTVEPVVRSPGLPQFDDATSAVQVGDTLWFGTYRGDRVAYRPAP
jgi:hypothetical protein